MSKEPTPAPPGYVEPPPPPPPPPMRDIPIRESEVPKRPVIDRDADKIAALERENERLGRVLHRLETARCTEYLRAESAERERDEARELSVALRAEIYERSVPVIGALDSVWGLLEYKSEWEYPGQVVVHIRELINELRAKLERFEGAVECNKPKHGLSVTSGAMLVCPWCVNERLVKRMEQHGIKQSIIRPAAQADEKGAE